MIPLGLIAQVQNARRDYQANREGWTRLQAEFAEKHTALRQKIGILEQKQNEAEDALRQAILAEFAATGNKQPAPGCGVRVVQKFFYEEEDAFGWAKEHGLALKLDNKAFERIAKAQPIGFVIIRDEPQASIATDLDKALAER